jgi:hypothetical protein
MTDGRLAGKYIVTARSAFKKAGKITVESEDFDTPLNKKLRRETKCSK